MSVGPTSRCRWGIYKILGSRSFLGEVACECLNATMISFTQAMAQVTIPHLIHEKSRINVMSILLISSENESFKLVTLLKSFLVTLLKVMFIYGKHVSSFFHVVLSK